MRRNGVEATIEITQLPAVLLQAQAILAAQGIFEQGVGHGGRLYAIDHFMVACGRAHITQHAGFTAAVIHPGIQIQALLEPGEHGTQRLCPHQ